MKTIIANKSKAIATLNLLTSKYTSCSFSKIGFDSKRIDMMGAAFKNEENEKINEASATFSLIETYNEKFQKVYRLHFNKC